MSAKQRSKRVLAPLCESRSDDALRAGEEIPTRSELMEPGTVGLRIRRANQTKIKHDSEYLPDGDLAFNIIGSRGTGKSTVMLEFLPHIANLSQVIICTRVANSRSDVYPRIEAYCKSTCRATFRQRKDDEPPIDFIVFTDPETACAGIQAKIDEKRDADEAYSQTETDAIIIFDDFSDAKSSRSDPYNHCMNVSAQLLRNQGYHIMCITQSATGLPTLTRNNANIRILFKMSDIHSIRSIRDDFVASRVVPTKEDFDALYDIILSKKHAYLMLVQNSGTENALYIYVPGQEPNKPHLVTGLGEHRLENGDDDTLIDLVRHDPSIARLASDIKKIEGDSHSASRSDSRACIHPADRYARSRHYRRLRSVVQSLARNDGARVEDIEAIIERIYGIDLS